MYGVHAAAILIVAVWGTTFVSTKLLINAGLRPVDIFFVRFLLAYICILPFAGRRLFADSFKDEALMVLLGITGGSFYFMAENVALQYSYCSNVSLIVCGTPLFTGMLLGWLYPEERLSGRQWLCSLLALAGMALVVLNGHFILKLSPKGDFLALCASLTWAVYSLGVRVLGNRYPMFFVTRKVFFYGLVTLLPVLCFVPLNTDLSFYARPVVWTNLLYLGVIASFGCYLGWNVVMKRIGVVRSTNYLYLNPVVTLFTAALFLSEAVTPLAVAGALLILSGIYCVNRFRSNTGK